MCMYIMYGVPVVETTGLEDAFRAGLLHTRLHTIFAYMYVYMYMSMYVYMSMSMSMSMRIYVYVSVYRFLHKLLRRTYT